MTTAVPSNGRNNRRLATAWFVFSSPSPPRRCSCSPLGSPNPPAVWSMEQSAALSVRLAGERKVAKRKREAAEEAKQAAGDGAQTQHALCIVQRKQWRRRTRDSA